MAPKFMTGPEAKRASFTNQGRAFTEIAPGSKAPKIDFSNIDPQWLAYQAEGQGPQSAGAYQSALNKIYQSGGPIANDDWRITGGLPTGFDPNTGKPYGIGERVGAGKHSIGYWEKIADPRNADQPFGPGLGELPHLYEFTKAGGTKDQWDTLTLPQKRQASVNIANAKQKAINDRWNYQKKKGGAGFILGQIGKLASLTATAGGVIGGPGFLGSAGTVASPSNLGAALGATGSGGITGLAEHLNPFKGTPTATSAPAGQGLSLPPELAEFVGPAQRAAQFVNSGSGTAAQATAFAGGANALAQGLTVPTSTQPLGPSAGVASPSQFATSSFGSLGPAPELSFGEWVQNLPAATVNRLSAVPGELFNKFQEMSTARKLLLAGGLASAGAGLAGAGERKIDPITFGTQAQFTPEEQAARQQQGKDALAEAIAAQNRRFGESGLGFTGSREFKFT